MIVAGGHDPITQELISAGIIPERCVKWTITSSIHDTLRITAEVLVTDEEYRKIADALLANKEEVSKALKLIAFSPLNADSKLGPL